MRVHTHTHTHTTSLCWKCWNQITKVSSNVKIQAKKAYIWLACIRTKTKLSSSRLSSMLHEKVCFVAVKADRNNGAGLTTKLGIGKSTQNWPCIQTSQQAKSANACFARSKDPQVTQRIYAWRAYYSLGVVLEHTGVKLCTCTSSWTLGTRNCAFMCFHFYNEHHGLRTAHQDEWKKPLAIPKNYTALRQRQCKSYIVGCVGLQARQSHKAPGYASWSAYIIIFLLSCFSQK